jgi:hypothetical protein
MPKRTFRNRVLGTAIVTIVMLGGFCATRTLSPATTYSATHATLVESIKLKAARECLRVGVFEEWAIKIILRHRIPPQSAKNLIWHGDGGI